MNKEDCVLLEANKAILDLTKSNKKTEIHIFIAYYPL